MSSPDGTVRAWCLAVGVTAQHCLAFVRSLWGGLGSNAGMRLVLVVAGLLCLGRADAMSACGCVEEASVEGYRHAFESFDGAVFRGTALRSERQKRGVTKVTFKIERVWKGVTSDEIAVYVTADPGCKHRLPKIGGSYLLHAKHEKGKLTERSCFYPDVKTPLRFLEAVGEGSPPPTQSPR